MGFWPGISLDLSSLTSLGTLRPQLTDELKRGTGHGFKLCIRHHS
jgi:hypothetical protein